jgi:hypothetical protein
MRFQMEVHCLTWDDAFVTVEMRDTSSLFVCWHLWVPAAALAQFHLRPLVGYSGNNSHVAARALPANGMCQ